MEPEPEHCKESFSVKTVRVRAGSLREGERDEVQRKGHSLNDRPVEWQDQYERGDSERPDLELTTRLRSLVSTRSTSRQ